MLWAAGENQQHQPHLKAEDADCCVERLPYARTTRLSRSDGEILLTRNRDIFQLICAMLLWKTCPMHPAPPSELCDRLCSVTYDVAFLVAPF